jgi:hypothetical protein
MGWAQSPHCFVLAQRDVSSFHGSFFCILLPSRASANAKEISQYVSFQKKRSPNMFDELIQIFISSTVTSVHNSSLLAIVLSSSTKD